MFEEDEEETNFSADLEEFFHDDELAETESFADINPDLMNDQAGDEESPHFTLENFKEESLEKEPEIPETDEENAFNQTLDIDLENEQESFQGVEPELDESQQ